MSALQAITDELLINAIDRATDRVVLIAPGMWLPVAHSVADAWKRLGSDRVTVILDVDPEICRIGYGELAALKLLQETAAALGESIGQEPGVRICVFVVDGQTFVFSPTPRQLESPNIESPSSDSAPVKTNGIIIAKTPQSLENELGLGPEGIEKRKLGLDTLDQKKLGEVEADLQRNPAKNFDLSRAVQVYNAKIQFVELTVAGCRLSGHRARLPSHLVQVLRNRPDLSQKIENSIRLIDDQDVLVNDPKLSEVTIGTHRQTIQTDFLKPIKGVGTVLERSRKQAFLDAIKTLKSEVEAFSKNIEAELAKRFEATAESLSGELLPEVLDNLPERWRKKLGPSPDPNRVHGLIREDLHSAFGTADGKVGKMKVVVVFKDVTYDMLTDPEFQQEVARHFPDLPVMEQYNAARERKKPAAELF